MPACAGMTKTKVNFMDSAGVFRKLKVIGHGMP